MKQLCACTLAALGAALAGCGGGSSSDEGPAPLTVTKAQCGSADRPETGLQGQVPAALRSAGFGGFSCNLELVGQNRGDGGNWQATQFRDKSGHKCAYHGTAFTTAGRTQTGVRVLDVTTPANPAYLASLTTPSMMDPWESLKVNERRQLLAADNGRNGAGGPEIDLYDLSGDCRTPQLLSSVAVGKDDGSGGAVAPIIGHEGSWSPDGLTYYGGGRTVPNNYYVIDTTSTTKPKLMMTWLPPKSASGGRTHGLSISEDGNRAYFTQIGAGNVDPAVAPVNGLVIADVSDIQSRKANPQIRVVSELYWKDGSTAQHTIAVKIGGKPYIIFVDEAGSAGTTTPATVKAACDANMTPFPMARIIDIADEKSPKVISKLMLETHDPKNCDKILPDMAGLAIFTYGSHYCSVDNRLNATTLACGYFNSGIRIFDIRNPERPREIAYYNPAGVEVPSTGSNHTQFGGTAAVGGRKPDWCSAQVHLDASNGTLWTTCQDNGVLVLRFTNGVWPFPESTTPAGLQN